MKKSATPKVNTAYKNNELTNNNYYDIILAVVKFYD